jgi:hypothetical protein
MSDIVKKWNAIHEVRRIMQRMRKTMNELDKLMVIAQQEICQPSKV